MSTKKDDSSNSNTVDYGPNRKIVDDGDVSDEELLLDACPYALIMSSIEDFRILGLNDTAASIFKQPKNKLIGMQLKNLLELDAGERRRQVAHRIITGKKPVILEDYERGVWWRTLFQPVVDKNEVVTKIAVFIENISEEKTQERRITEKNEEFWRRLIQYSHSSFFIVDEKGVIRYASESIHSIMGFTPKELIGKKVYDCVYESDKQKAKNFFSTILNKKSTATLSHRSKDKNGIIRHMETTANNLLENPIVQGIIITSRDVSKIRKAEIKTKEMKQYLENIINSTSELIFSIDHDDKITTWNTRMYQITGYTSKSIIGKNIFSISLLLDDETFKSYLNKCYKKMSTPIDIKIKTRHDDNRLLRIEGSLVKTDEKDVKGVVFTGKDITSDAQIHGNLVRGSSYLISDENNTKAVSLLNGLVLKEYNGMVVTRDITDNVFCDSSKSLPVTQYCFSEKIQSVENGADIVSKPSTLVKLITDFFSENKNSIALIDRLDYLIALHGFPVVMQSIYSISSIASKYNGIVLIRLNPTILSVNESAILKEELKDLPEQTVKNVTIDKKLFDILQFIEKQNQNKSVVSYKTIGKRFSITKVTTAKRIKALAEEELVAIKKKGRLKTVFVTDKGKRLLQRRNVV